jgi:hypothetical protein
MRSVAGGFFSQKIKQAKRLEAASLLHLHVFY